MSQRLAAMRKLSENPHDIHALNEMHQEQSGVSYLILKSINIIYIFNSKA